MQNQVFRELPIQDCNKECIGGRIWGQPPPPLRQCIQCLRTSQPGGEDLFVLFFFIQHSTFCPAKFNLFLPPPPFIKNPGTATARRDQFDAQGNNYVEMENRGNREGTILVHMSTRIFRPYPYPPLRAALKRQQLKCPSS